MLHSLFIFLKKIYFVNIAKLKHNWMSDFKMRYYFLPFFSGILNLQASDCINFSDNENKPNVILILIDDLGYSELGCYGNKFNETPNIDKLASEGIIFTQAYSASTVSSPSRAALLTGLYPLRTSITDYLRPNSSQYLDTSFTTIAEILKKNEYHTGIIGKWHLTGYKSDNAPVEISPDFHGFDEVISSEITGIGNGSYFHPYHFNPELKKILNDEDKEFLVDRMNYEAIQFIEKNCENPFFLYLSHYAVHTMLHGKPEIVDHFRKKENCGNSPASKENKENDPYKKWPSDYFASENNPHLAAQLKSIDEGVKLIRDKLKELKLDKNTIIIFTSDNGGETRVTSNFPLREGKSTLYEGGIRIPLIIWYPDKINGGKSIDMMTINFDLFPTICNLCNIKIPDNLFLDGISLVPFLFEKPSAKIKKRTLYWYYPLEKKHFLGGRSSGAINNNRWKLIEFYDTGEKELYLLKNDIGETKNLISVHPKIAAKLQKKLETWKLNVLKNPLNSN